MQYLMRQKETVSAPFSSDRERVEHLLARYESLSAPALAAMDVKKEKPQTRLAPALDFHSRSHDLGDDCSRAFPLSHKTPKGATFASLLRGCSFYEKHSVTQKSI